MLKVYGSYIDVEGYHMNIQDCVLHLNDACDACETYKSYVRLLYTLIFPCRDVGQQLRYK